MASSSTSSIHKTNFKYDVFLSFRGEDTRTNFVDHLYHALKLENIETYKDDENLEKGKIINKELIQAIQDSRFHVIVFSKNYASSSWCLDELVKIMECQKTTTEHTVYPIFYRVEPTEVRKQSGEFGKAFAKHEKAEAAQKWREALVEAASLSGQDLTADRHEVEFIKTIVKDISSKLPVANVDEDENLIGMRTRVNGVVSSLNAFRDELCMMGIAGMGGSGKTTLARAVFDQICNEFEGSSFVENVRECSDSLLLGLKSLQQQVLRDVFNRKDITVNGVFDGKKMMKKKLPGIKVLVVLDDVDHLDQLKALAGEPNWFMKGSRIIITTRDKQVLLAHRVNLIHDADLLTNEEAICLLSRCAFGTKVPIPGYEELSKKVVSYAAGLPLTITILGSSFCDENEHVWIDTLKELEKIPLDGTLQKLELSYMGLDTNCKEIFLDVACILKGWGKDEAIRVLESRGFHAIRGLSVLEKKSLVTISKYGHLEMHDHIEEMGRYIVRRLHPDEPNKHSRLWIGEEIEDILANNRGTEATTCIHLMEPKINPETVIKGLGKMEKLRLLYVRTDDFGWDWEPVEVSQYFPSSWELDEVSQYFPNSLQYLKWDNYPFRSLPKTFQASNLVALEMFNCRIEQLWKGGDTKVFDKLKFLHINHSKLRTFDLRGTPNLETLRLVNCVDLVELHFSIECLKLRSLNIGYSKLRTLDLRGAPNLETLSLVDCVDLVELHFSIERLKLRSLNIGDSTLRTLDLRGASNLETLSLVDCVDLVELHFSIERLKLRSLNIGDSTLRTLDLRGASNLETLSLFRCYDLVELRVPIECRKLESLTICVSKLRTLDLRGAPNLERLKVRGCHDLVELPIHVACLNLKSIDIIATKLRTFDLGLTLNLKMLSLKKCYQLEELHSYIGSLKRLVCLDLSGCLRFKSFLFKERVESLEVGSLSKLHLIAESLDMCPLHSDNNLPKFRFTRSYEEHMVPSAIGNLEELISIGLCACTDIQRSSLNICGLRCLTKLTLKGGIQEAPKDLGQLECLVELSLSMTKITHLPESICMLNHLKVLKLNSCSLLEKLPVDLGQLECLEELFISDCVFLRDIPKSICRMKRLKYLCLTYCLLVEKLPEELGCLECLQVLNIEGTSISHLPQSIFTLKGLSIIGFRWLLESFGFASGIQLSRYVALCHI